MIQTRSEWSMLPDREGTWLYIEVWSESPSIVRVYAKDNKVWMVKNGHRQRIRSGFWFPLGPRPPLIDLVKKTASEVEPDDA